MRLIDADKLINRLWEQHKGIQANADMYTNADEVAEEVCYLVSLIDEQSTVETINGREYVSKYGSCPMCMDCPDACPLEKKRISIPPKGGNVAQKD